MVFSLGLILVIVGGAELFTGNTLIVMAWAGGRVSARQLLRNWLLVYIGNFIGALSIAGLVFAGGQYTVLAIVPPTAVFVAVGFERSVADMYLLPIALLIRSYAPAPFWAATARAANDYPRLRWTASASKRTLSDGRATVR